MSEAQETYEPCRQGGLRKGEQDAALGRNMWLPKPTDGVGDNWKHRSAAMRCQTCMAFVEKVTTAIQESSHIVGRCRRHAPTMQGFPVVYSDDWCLDHKLDETKL